MVTDEGWRVCHHAQRRQISDPELLVVNGRMLTKHLWWCPECGDKWSVIRKRGDVKRMTLVVDFT